VLGGSQEIGELLKRYRCNLLMLKSIKPTTIGQPADTGSMLTIAAIALPLAVLGLKYGPEDRPGFNERTPLS
jgi:hypothetical protein